MTINPDGRQSEGASASQIGLSQAEPVSRLRPSGFDPSRIEIYAKGCRAIIERLENAEPQYYAETIEVLERRHDLLADEVRNIAGMVMGLAEAIAMEARRGETPKSGSTAEGGDSAGPQDIAQPQVPSP